MSCNGEYVLAPLPQTHELEVESGPNGFEEFLGKVRSLFGIDAEQQMDLTFDCAEPATGTGLAQLLAAAMFTMQIPRSNLYEVCGSRATSTLLAGQPLQLAGSGAFDAAVHCAAMAAASRARKRLRRSAIARRLLAPFARSASCHATMDTATSADSATTESRDPPAGPMRRSARSTSSLSSSSTELPGPGAHINVQPAHSDIDVQGDEAAPKGIALPQPRWGLSSDCERLLWR